MKNIQTDIIINADISTVWNVLLDFERHPSWNPLIKSIKGEQKVGKKLTVSIKPPDGNGMTFKPKILIVEPNKEFRWKGKKSTLKPAQLQHETLSATQKDTL